MSIAFTSRISTFLLISGFCLLGASTTARAAHPGPPSLSAEQARIIAIHRGERGRYGDLLQVTIQAGVVFFHKYRGYHPVSFRIANGETKTVVFRSAQRRSYHRPIRVSYIGGVFVLEPNTSAAVGFRYSPMWGRGRFYRPLDMRNSSRSRARGVQVGIKIVPPRYRSARRHRDPAMRYGDAIRVTVSGGIMRFPNHKYRGFVPATFSLAQGESKVITFKSQQRYPHYRRVRVTYRRGVFVFEAGARGAQRFPFRHKWRRGVLYDVAAVGPYTASRGRNLQIAIALSRPRHGHWREKRQNRYRYHDDNMFDDSRHGRRPGDMGHPRDRNVERSYRNVVVIKIRHGTMVIDHLRQRYQPVHAVLSSGERKLIRISSSISRDEYTYIPVSYLHGRVYIDGNHFVRDFPRRLPAGHMARFDNVNFGHHSTTKARGITIKLIKR